MSDFMAIKNYEIQILNRNLSMFLCMVFQVSNNSQNVELSQNLRIWEAIYLECSWHAFLSTGNVQTGGCNCIVRSSLQLSRFICFLKIDLRSVDKRAGKVHSICHSARMLCEQTVLRSITNSNPISR
jgi:hypothetical protein